MTLTDTLPKNAGYASATTSQGTCTAKPSRQLVTCSLGSIPSGGNATTITIVVKPTAKGTIFNTATVSAQEADPNASNNSASAATTLQP